MMGKRGNDRLRDFCTGLWGFCVLKTLEAEPCYGYDIVRQLSEIKGLSTNETTIYRILGELKKQGLVGTSMRKSPIGPPRKYYRITGRGRRELALRRHTWELISRGVDGIGKAPARRGR